MNPRVIVLPMLMAVSAAAGPVMVPDATSIITFTGSFASIPGSGNCLGTIQMAGVTTSTCSGVNHTFVGDDIIGTTNFSSTAGTTGQTASGSILYGVSGESGGRVSVSVSIDYFVALFSTAPPPTLLTTLRIPIDVAVVGSVTGFTGEGSNTAGFAISNVHESGGGDVDGSISDDVSGSALAGNLDLHYGETKTFVFGFDEGTPMVEVFLEFQCEGQVDTGVGSRDFSCQGSADPTFTFNQPAFDAAMGANTFHLADYFGFATSPGIDASADGSVPEPASFLLASIGLSAAWIPKRRWTKGRTATPRYE